MLPIAGLVALLLLVATTSGQGGSPAPTPCQDLGPVAPDFGVFLRTAYSASNTQLEGRLAVGGSANLSNWSAGTALPPDSARLDAIVGGDLSVANSRLPNGSATYGRTLVGTLPTPNGTLRRAPPPFSIGSAMTELEVRSVALGQIAPNGTVSGPAAGTLLMSGSDPDRNVFTLAATTMQSAQRIEISVPPGSTVLVNVTGSTYSTVQDAQLASVETAAGAGRTLWNFPNANALQIGPGVAWQGTLLAPFAGIRLPPRGSVTGQVIGRSLVQAGTIGGRFDGCVTPPVRPSAPLSLTSLCVDPIADTVALRLRNETADTRDVEWEDRSSAQQGSFTVGPRHDYVFLVAQGTAPHDIVARAGDATAEVRTTTRRCQGAIVLRKLVTGTGAPADGRWRIDVSGDNGVSRDVTLAAGGRATLRLPGRIADGEVPLGVLPGGVQYTITEPDPQGAASTTIDYAPVTILDGDVERVTIVNDYVTAPPPPPPPPPPGDSGFLPIEPVLPPGTPLGRPGPGIVVAPGAADLAIDERIAPSRIVRNGVVTVVVRVRNAGRVPAVGTVAREIPQLDPLNPNRTARVLSVSSSGGAPDTTACSRRRPVRCELGTLQPGQDVVVRVAARVLAAHPLRSVVMVSSPTPDTNATNNFDHAHLRVLLPPPRVAAAIAAPRSVRAGAPLSYRVSAIGTGRRGARFVRFCHRPPAGLLVSSAPGAIRRGDLLCRDVSALGRGQRSSFVVRAVAAASAAGRRLRLGVTALAPGAPPSRTSTPLRVLVGGFGGRG
ncbi:choice-of-anchor A family protein [Conexibacter woesei]|uniref:Uncharacterized protein n=1 Tax=Conexibacter woesei (strain DSM 14684 / CCUG 47730 / CIP 108061 / JCM 11494 / NBRC 100937 / ID131577) TaxID=469383 RepID=D3F769_CONWI|nr:choice-of-anchor A family protein [Conexibacter woesei]ADB48840.1 hypothetical protein Cwoe_0404 [Conexibacter woesei DSM 14684]